MSNATWARRAGLVIGTLAIVVAACGGGSSKAPSAAPSGASLENVQKSTVFIVVEGRFTSPDGAAVEDYVGSGFVIGADGIVVTNNHVVTGASIIKVFFDGEDVGRDAQVLGVSECDDLAVLKVGGVSGLATLTWNTAAATTGMDVWAAGHPDGDEQFNLSQGIVSKAPGPAATSWASIQQEIQHSAQIRGGSSGGPLVDRAGSVVGINYAAPVGGTAGVNYAIAAAEAKGIVDELQGGEDITSIGLNGEALDDGSGIWVSSVKPGSPLDKAGVKAGDTITSFGGVDAAAGGTVAKYCSVLRSAGPGATIDIEINREGETYAGQVNGRELAPTHTSTASEGPGVTPAPGGDAADLLTHIPEDFSDTCVEDALFTNVIASLKCFPTSGADIVWYDLYPSDNLMFETYADHRDAEGLNDTGDCATEPGEGGYTLTVDGQDLSGDHWRLLCYNDESGGAWMEWTDPDLAILAYIYREDADFAALNDFWVNSAGPVH